MVGLVNSVGAVPAAHEQTKQTDRQVASFPDDAGAAPMWVRPQGSRDQTETSRAVTPADFERFTEQREVSTGNELERAERQAASHPGLGDRVDLFA
ncbi:MAG: hypothetical protein DHS20C16_00790 [Phycisphaerae bacterium]|nr:MAG: hypothetical protein DHS20C16_00790 [Phycisphaerae bacterium]